MIQTESSSVTVTREGVGAIRSDGDSVYLCTTMNVAFVIKARYFASKEDFEEVKAYLVKHYAPA